MPIHVLLESIFVIQFQRGKEERNKKVKDRKKIKLRRERGSWLNRNDGFLVSPLHLVKLSCGPANRAHSGGFFRKWLSTSALRKSRQGAEWSSTACEIELEVDWIFMRSGISLSSSASPFSPIESPDVATWYPVETRYPASLCRWRRALWWKCRSLHGFEHYADYNEPNLPKRCKILLIIRIVCNFLKSFLIWLSYRCFESSSQGERRILHRFLTCWYLHYHISVICENISNAIFFLAKFQIQNLIHPISPKKRNNITITIFALNDKFL